MKCPHCGCDTDAPNFLNPAGLNPGPTALRFSVTDVNLMPYGDMTPTWYDGQWWYEWSSYMKRRRENGDADERA